MTNGYRALLVSLFLVTTVGEGYGQANQPSPSNTGAGFEVNTMNREEARIFFNAVYSASENVPIEWTGSITTGNAGTTSQAFRDSVALRINYFRAMAGVPAEISLSDEWNRKAQEAALMMSVNNELNHFPPRTWLFYTPEGAEAAGNSNLHLGSTGPDAISSLMRDHGQNNGSVGHRRWILFPQTRIMGTGNIPATGTQPATSALWVIDQTNWKNGRSKTRETFVAWPPKGYCPYQVVYPRWSFSYPDADFSASKVSMERGGWPINVTIESVGAKFGENTIVWVPKDFAGSVNNSFASAARPADDTVTAVTIHDVGVNGVIRDFSYTVTVFDPHRPSVDTAVAIVSGSGQLTVGESSTFSWNLIPNATGYEWQVARRTPVNSVEFVESRTGTTTSGSSTTVGVVSTVTVIGDGGGFVTPPTLPPDPFGNSSVDASFHLSHSSNLADQFVTVKQSILPRVGSTLRFGSRVGWASENQIATVEVSTDGGSSWKEIYRQAGDNGPGENSSTTRLVDLSEFADQMLLIRFAYHYTGGIAYTGNSQTGWYVSGISITQADQLSTLATGFSSEGKFTYIPTNAGDLVIQVRPQFYGRFFGEWGPVKRVSVTGSSFALTAPSHSPNGAFTFTLNGEIGHTYIIETSPNLRDWSPLRPVFTTSTVTAVVDVTTVPASVRFYRAVRTP